MPIVALALGLALQDAPKLPALSIRPSGDGYVVFAAGSFAKSIYWDVDAAAMARARASCGNRQLLWGGVHFLTDLGVGGKPATVREFRHDFKCDTAGAALHPPAPANWTAGKADIADARRVATSFLDRRDHGDMDGAYAMFDPQALGNRDAAIADTRKLLAQTAPGKVNVTGVNWMINPPRLPYPGAFAVVLVTADYPGLHFYCGYIGLYRRGPGDYRIIRDQFSYLPKGGGNDAPGYAARMRAELCSGN